jgi:choice-of-anchor B domain-containing protein
MSLTQHSASEDGYVHDAQCLIYRGPDAEFEGHEICYGYNEDSLTIYDVTDKKAPVILSNTSYEGAAYTHQGNVLDPMNQQFLLLDDEYDEYDQVGPAIPGHPITYIWDISSLRAPKQTGLYKSGAKGIDHNQYVANGFAYQSNYGTGFRVLDVRSIPDDPTGAGVKEVGFFGMRPHHYALKVILLTLAQMFTPRMTTCLVEVPLTLLVHGRAMHCLRVVTS